MKKILSFSLYGDKPLYAKGCIKNADLHLEIFKDWEMQVFHNNTVPKDILNELEDKSVILINMDENKLFANSMWRFLPASENIERFISRDCDSRISLRDECAVNEWIESDKDFHIIRDHPYGHDWAINAGMWGCKGGVITNIKELMNSYEKRTNLYSNKFMDQYFLRDVIYPIAVKNLFLHDVFFNREGIGVNIKRELSEDDYNFIGGAIDEFENPMGGGKSDLIRYLKTK